MTTTSHVPAIDARTVDAHATEVARGERFEFGRNWTRFLGVVDLNRIQHAQDSLSELLGRDSLTGKQVPGYRVGQRTLQSGRAPARCAGRVVRLRPAVGRRDSRAEAPLRCQTIPTGVSSRVRSWTKGYVGSLGSFDVVYSWGVLHHTGAMWRALDLAQRLVNDEGLLAIAIYNDRGSQSARWRHIKRTYSRLPRVFKTPFAALVSAPEEMKGLVRSILTGRPGDYVRSWTQYDTRRGMSHWHDIIDWVGGFPYECARPDTIFSFFKQRGFTLERLTIGGGLGCSEYVFRRAPRHASSALTGR